MSINDLHETIQSLAESIVLADPDDLAKLAQMHEDLQTISTGELKPEWISIEAAARKAADVLEAVMLREVETPADAMKAVASTIAAIQSVIVHGQPVESVFGNAGAANEAAAPSEHASAAVHQSANDEAQDAPATDEAFTLTGDGELMAEFINESKEHLDAVDVHLLTIENTPTETEAINAVFRAFHTIKGVAGFLELKPIQALAHESETLLDKCRKGTLTLADAALDVTFEAADAMKQLVADVEQAMGSDRVLRVSGSMHSLLVRINAIADGKAPPAAAAPASKEKAQAQAAAVETPTPASSEADATPASSAPASQPETAARQKTPPPTTIKETVRVDADRLDKLVDAIGEMVIAEAMVSQSPEFAGKASTPLMRTLNHLDKITRELQELAMSLRMVSVRSAFQRMAKLARDVSKKLGKPVEFVTAGEETELDKNVVDAIGDPLVHMVRNAIDHGLEESPEQRVAAGKPEAGRVELRAFHKGGSIYIEIEDDGRGIDRDVILKKAKERGLVDDGDKLTDSEVFSLIFEPGFSTAKSITDVSGRGVGLDVVKRNIQALRGKVEIRSEKGKGSVFSIRLPLTLAIIEGMVVRLGGQRFILPTLSIVRMIRPGEEDMSTVLQQGEMLRIGDQLIPLYRLGRLLNVPNTCQNPSEAAVVVVEHDSKQIGLLVDDLLGQQQIVIKPLGTLLRQYPGFSGGAIMPDGRVGLILDIAAMAAMASTDKPALAAA